MEDMNTNHRYRMVQLATMAMMTAISSVLIMLITVPFPLFPDFRYDLADVPILITAFSFGPVSGLIVTAIASAIQAFALGQAGLMGFMMHMVATGIFVIVAGCIYKHHKTKHAALLGLVLGTLAMTVLMCILNLVLDPIFWGTPREAVLRLLVPAIIPFNLSKAGINSLITFLIYKRVSKLIHRAEDRSR